jgi:phosphopantothenoylcysteine decarboxylase/phosphopantothenate--cysteine ligase
MSALKDKQILLVISGGIAAYKSLELIRLIRKAGGAVRCILTKGGEQFVTPLSVAALSEAEVYTDLWSLKDETEMGHIRLSREADLIVIAPASANLIAKIAGGFADDLATTMLLASDKPALFAPAMNHMMWSNAATKENVEKIIERGYKMIAPTEGDMACGEFGIGRLAEPADILDAIETQFKKKALSGFKALVTSGPTHEPLDPVRFLGNRSSGKQGHAIARALQAQGAEVTLISGPTSLPAPSGMKIIHIETAGQMIAAAEAALPADIAICAAAVADWKPAKATDQKMKKRDGGSTPSIQLIENPDILKTLANHKTRPKLVVGFAAETSNTLASAKEKLLRKGCDWIVANEVGTTQNPAFGADENRVILVTRTSHEEWEQMSKQLIADRLVAHIVTTMTDEDSHGSDRHSISTGKR